MENSFKIGDVVVLKSGSPKMVIHSIFSDGSILVKWYEAGGIKEYDKFLPPMLFLTEPVPPTPIIS